MPGAATGQATWLASPNAAPNLRLGLRTTLACVPPLLAASLLHGPSLIWMALGGLYMNMADTGGAYRTKALAMACATLLGALALGAGILLAAWPWLCVPAMAAVALGCGLLAPAALPARAPRHGRRPAGVARYHRLACPTGGGEPAAEELLYSEKIRVRTAPDTAGATLAATRSGRLGASPADGAFTQLIETTDAQFVTSAALGDLLAAIPAPAAHPIRQRMGALNGRCVAALRANLTLESSVFRHGLRFGVASAVAVGTSTLFALPIGHWITLTVSVILRPSAGETLSRTSQRVLGTVLGGILAIVLATCFPHPLVLVLLLAPLTLVMMAVLPVNYGLFVFFLTPWIVLYKDIDQPGDWNLALWRIANTVIGAAVALAAIHLVLPRWERSHLPNQLAASLRSNARFVQQVLDRLLDTPAAGTGPLATPADVRLEMGNAHISMQRFLSEKTSQQAMAVPLMAFLLHSQRLVDAAVVLGHVDHRRGDPQPPASLRPLRERIVEALSALASALEHQGPPAPLPKLHRPDPTAEPLQQQLAKLVDPVIGLHSAVEAWSAWARRPA